MAALTRQRPQDRAEQINADVAQRARAIVAQHGDTLGLTEYEQKLDRERAVAATEASLLRGYVHSLCREIARLTPKPLAAAGEHFFADKVGMDRPVLVTYEPTSDGACLDAVFIGDEQLPAHPDADVFTPWNTKRWQEMADAHLRQLNADAQRDAEQSMAQDLALQRRAA